MKKMTKKLPKAQAGKIVKTINIKIIKGLYIQQNRLTKKMFTKLDIQKILSEEKNSLKLEILL